MSYEEVMTSQVAGQAKAFLSSAKARNARITVVGDLALDRFIFGSVDRISPEAPVPVLFAEKTIDHLGCAANVARNIAELMDYFSGLTMQVCGVVGVDMAGAQLERSLKELSPRMESTIFQDATRPTTLKTRFLAGTQHQLLRVDIENPQSLSPQLCQAVENAMGLILEKTDLLILQDYAKGFFSKPLLQSLIALAKSHKVKVLVDPNSRTPAQFYAGTWLLTPNVSEAEHILKRSLGKGANDEEMAAACRDLKRELSLEMAMITRSRYGLTLLDAEDRVHHFPALARAVFDVTGAGDTLVAVLGSFLALGAPLEIACALANAAASVVVAKVGTATASVDEISRELSS